MRTLLAVAVACAAVPIWSAGPDRPAPPPSPAPRLVAHEWGTFTSFSGADGEPVSFDPDNSDLPPFVYRQQDPFSKSGRLAAGGTVSMETPVVYLYADRETDAAVKVDFPKGWITEWYPFAAAAPAATRPPPGPAAPGQSIRWNVRVLPNAAAKFPREPEPDYSGRTPERELPGYYHARETDAAVLRAEFPVKVPLGDQVLHGGTIAHHERFLFYRGVGQFPPPVTVKALGGGKVVVRNGAAGGTVTGVVLLTVRDGKIGFRPLADLGAGAEATAALPAADGDTAALAEKLAASLTAAGLYDREARAMVKTWDRAWFREDGTRVLYLVPRAKTDELLPLSIDPKPAEMARVLVGRFDFLTPEQEAATDKLEAKARAARESLADAERELAKIGRFAPQARREAGNRLDRRAVGR